MPQLLIGNNMEPDKFNAWFFNPAMLNEQTADELREMTENYPWFQFAWVLYTKNLKQINSREYSAVLKKAAVRVSNHKLFFNFINSESKPRELSVETGNSFSLLGENEDKNTTPGDSLIDRFLSSNKGSMRRNSIDETLTENRSHEDVLERSMAEDDELVTETLANIYFQQKNYVKAIQSFKKLSLKYPEKSIYFASRIKEAEDLKNI